MNDKPKYDSIPGHVSMAEVQSSQIHSIGHDAVANQLYVTFKGRHGPTSTYRYDNVRGDDHTALLGKDVEGHSIGAHFGQGIKASPSKYPYAKLNLEPKESCTILSHHVAAIACLRSQTPAGRVLCAGAFRPKPSG